MATSIVKSGIDFLRGAGGAIAATAAAVSDPLKWAQAFGFMTDQHWIIPVEVRQAIFAGIAFLWMFIWYHRAQVRFDEKNPVFHPVPLHQAARYIVGASLWGVRYRGDEGEWVSRLTQEMQAAFSSGEVRTRGYRRSNNSVHPGISDIPPDFWELALWDAAKLVTDEPVHIVAGKNAIYVLVAVDGDQMRRKWPPSARRLLWRSTPLKRIGDYRPKWAQQDSAYADRAAGRLSAIEAVFGEGR
jgi:hypothetical protein